MSPLALLYFRLGDFSTINLCSQVVCASNTFGKDIQTQCNHAIHLLLILSILCCVFINSVLLNLLCVWILSTLVEQHETVLYYEHTGRLAEKVFLLSLCESGAIRHVNVPKCRREVRIIARLETPPLLLVC